MRIGRQQRQRVRRRDEPVLADDQVPVPVPIRGGAEIGPFRCHQQVLHVLAVDKVRIRVPIVERWRGHAIDDGALGRAEHAFENGMGIGAGNGMHGIERHAEATGEQGADGVKIKQRLHQRGVVFDRVDHLDHHVADHLRANRIQVDIGRIERSVAVDHLGAGIDRVGDLFGCRTTIADIVLDAEIALRPAGIVAG